MHFTEDLHCRRLMQRCLMRRIVSCVQSRRHCAAAASYLHPMPPTQLPRALNDGELTAGRYSGVVFTMDRNTTRCLKYDPATDKWVNDTSLPPLGEDT